MTKRKANRRDVAQEAGVSVATVSYVINDGPRPVGAATRQRVLAAIKKVGYRPNLIARTLAGGKSNTYGFVAPNISNPFISEIAHSLQAYAYSLGKLVLVGDSADSAKRERNLLAAFLARQMDGIIYMGVTQDLAVDILKDASTPVVVVTHANSDGYFPSVRIDEKAAAALLTRHLLEHGYRRLSFLTGPKSMTNSHLRLSGMLETLYDYGQEPVSVGWEAYSRASGYRWAMKLANANELPRAIVTGNERQAAGIMAAFNDLSISIPHEVALGALNGSSASAYLCPSLTCIRQSLGQLADAAFRILQQPQAFSNQPYSCEYDLAVAQSCGCSQSIPRSGLASWNTPGANSLDSVAGIPLVPNCEAQDA